MFVYPLQSIVFPLLMKRAAASIDDEESQETYFGSLLLQLQNLLGIQKDVAWMNYTALVTAGGAIGPFASQLVLQWINRQRSASEKNNDDSNKLQRVSGLQFSMRLQMFANGALLVILMLAQRLDVAILVLALVVCWAVIVMTNNLFTTYFSTFCQIVLRESGGYGRYTANIITLFNLANILGTAIFGWVMGPSPVDWQSFKFCAVVEEK